MFCPTCTKQLNGYDLRAVPRRQSAPPSSPTPGCPASFPGRERRPEGRRRPTRPENHRQGHTYRVQILISTFTSLPAKRYVRPLTRRRELHDGLIFAVSICYYLLRSPQGFHQPPAHRLPRVIPEFITSWLHSSPGKKKTEKLIIKLELKFSIWESIRMSNVCQIKLGKKRLLRIISNLQPQCSTDSNDVPLCFDRSAIISITHALVSRSNENIRRI